MQPDSKLRFVERLSYIIEALAQDCVSDAKFEIGELIARVERGDLANLNEKLFCLEKLREAERMMRAAHRNFHAAVCCLSGLSREIWKAVVPERFETANDDCVKPSRQIPTYDPKIAGSFGQVMRVPVHDLDTLPDLCPLEDKVFQYLLGEVVVGRIPLYFGAVPLALIEPYDQHYHPENHPVGKIAVNATVTGALRGEIQKMWVYPNGQKYIVADDYIPYAAALIGQPDFVPCWIMGNARFPGVESHQGPIEPHDVKRLLGWA
jgi:hypothetical protein